MVWKRDNPQGNESGKIRWELVPYTRGRGLDIGCGPYITFPHFIRVDNCIDEVLFGIQVKPAIRIDTATELPMFASKSMDFVFSSHLLEHIDPDYVVPTLREWWRVLKHDGHLVLYLPSDELYPKVGEPGANPDHKWNVSFDVMMKLMERGLNGWDLIRYEHRDQGEEYSHFFVFKKVGAGRHLSYKRAPDPRPRAAVIRYGAIGDNLQASSVFAGLQAQGFHVTVYATPPGSDVIAHDPNVDTWVLQDKDQVPNDKLQDFWAWLARRYDRFVNLSESVEDTWLASQRKIQFFWPPALRHAHLNVNYLEHQHELAGVPHIPKVKFYPTPDEATWAAREKSKLGGFVLLWSLAGSSRHKTWPYLDNLIAMLMLEFPTLKVVLVGDQASQLLERGWENEARVIRRSGVWPIRKSLAFAQIADVVVGPETGILNSVCCEPMPKVVFLSHSTHENLTRDWVNVHPLISANTSCPGRGENAAPACHQLHYDWSHCKRAKDAKGEDMGVAQCQADIGMEEAAKVIWHVVTWELERREGKRA